MATEVKSHSWTMGEAASVALAELRHIGALVEDHDRAVEAGESAVLAVPVSAATVDPPAEIARRLGLPVGTVSTSTLALDGSEYLLGDVVRPE